MARVYSLPDFNVASAVFGPGGTTPLTFPYITFCQLYVYSRLNFVNATAPGLLTQGLIAIRFPIEILGTGFPAPGQLVNCLVEVFASVTCPQAYYVIDGWEVMHRGFANEYVSCMVHQSDAAGGPIDPTREYP